MSKLMILQKIYKIFCDHLFESASVSVFDWIIMVFEIFSQSTVGKCSEILRGTKVTFRDFETYPVQKKMIRIEIYIGGIFFGVRSTAYSKSESIRIEGNVHKSVR